MKIEATVRVVKSSAATEVFINRDKDPYINFAVHLPPDADVSPGESIEFVSPADLTPAPKQPPPPARLSTARPTE